MKKLLLALITSLLPCLVSAQSQCGQCHSTVVQLTANHPNVQQLSAADCSKCHAEGAKGIFQKIHESHKGKVPCGTCHPPKQDSVVLRQLSNGETISVTREDFELYSDLLSTEEESSSKLHLSKGLRCNSCHKESAPQEGATVDNGNCLACHGSYEELAKKTQKAEKSDNPHTRTGFNPSKHIISTAAGYPYAGVITSSPSRRSRAIKHASRASVPFPVVITECV